MAMGTNAAGLKDFPCPTGSPSLRCFRNVYYADIKYALAHYQATIATSST